LRQADTSGRDANYDGRSAISLRVN
jgi:hypothetical protein